MKQLSPQEIDAIVRDVISRMGLPSGRVEPVDGNGSECSCTTAGRQSASPVPASSAIPAPPKTAVAMPSTKSEPVTVYRITSRLVTMETLPDLSGIRQVEVPHRAIVTPAVLDELRRRGVTLEFAKTAGIANKEDRAGGAALASDKKQSVSANLTSGVAGVLAVVRSRFSAADSLLGAVRGEVSPDATLYTAKCLLQATDDLSAVLVGRGRAAVIVTDHAAAAVCLANRRRGMRAIQAVPHGAMAATAALDAMLRDAAECGANLLMIDPRDFGFWILRQVVVRFLKSGPWPVPDSFQSRLD